MEFLSQTPVIGSIFGGENDSRCSALKNELQALSKEADMLTGQLDQRAVEQQELVSFQKRYQAMISTNETQMATIRHQQLESNEPSSKDWEEQCSTTEVSIRQERESNSALEEELAGLIRKLDTLATDYRRLVRRSKPNPYRSNSDSESEAPENEVHPCATDCAIAEHTARAGAGIEESVVGNSETRKQEGVTGDSNTETVPKEFEPVASPEHPSQEAPNSAHENTKEANTSRHENNNAVSEVQSIESHDSMQEKDKENAGASHELKSEKPSHKRSDGISGFKKRFHTMLEGSTLHILQNGKYGPCFVSLSESGKVLTVTSKKQKNPFVTVSIADITNVEYPSTTVTSRTAQSGKGYMKFSIHTEGESVHFLAPSADQLQIWVIGLQNMSACSSEGTLVLGGFLWAKLRAKIIEEAAERQVSPYAAIIQALEQSIRIDEDLALEEESGGDTERSEQVRLPAQTLGDLKSAEVPQVTDTEQIGIVPSPAQAEETNHDTKTDTIPGSEDYKEMEAAETKVETNETSDLNDATAEDVSLATQLQEDADGVSADPSSQDIAPEASGVTGGASPDVPSEELSHSVDTQTRSGPIEPAVSDVHEEADLEIKDQAILDEADAVEQGEEFEPDANKASKHPEQAIPEASDEAGDMALPSSGVAQIDTESQIVK